MRALFVKLYDWLTAPIYRRLARDLTVQLQEISRSYLEQHEMLTSKMLDELLRLNIRIDDMQLERTAREKALASLTPELTTDDLNASEIFDLLNESYRSLDVVQLCIRRNIPLAVYYELDAKYRGLEPERIRAAKLLEETNLELRALVTRLMRQQAAAVER